MVVVLVQERELALTEELMAFLGAKENREKALTLKAGWRVGVSVTPEGTTLADLVAEASKQLDRGQGEWIVDLVGKNAMSLVEILAVAACMGLSVDLVAILREEQTREG